MRGRPARFPVPVDATEGSAKRLEFGFCDVLLHLGLFQNFHDLLHFIEGIAEKASDVFDFFDGGADGGGGGRQGGGGGGEEFRWRLFKWGLRSWLRCV